MIDAGARLGAEALEAHAESLRFRLRIGAAYMHHHAAQRQVRDDLGHEEIHRDVDAWRDPVGQLAWPEDVGSRLAEVSDVEHVGGVGVGQLDLREDVVPWVSSSLDAHGARAYPGRAACTSGRRHRVLAICSPP